MSGQDPIVGDELSRLRSENLRLQALVRINQRLHSSLGVDQVLETIVEVATRSLDAQRSTLYVIDHERGEVWSRIAQGDNVGEIRLKMGEGIAGYVAQTGKRVRIPDAHKDRRFYPHVDAATGFRTRSMLCMPLEQQDGKRIGVVQVMNKNKGQFTAQDEEYLEALCVQAALSLENAQYTSRLAALSEQNQQLAELLEQRLRDLQSLKMLSMKHMARGIAHDVNNASAKIKDGAESLQQSITHLQSRLSELVQGKKTDTRGLEFLLNEGVPLSLDRILEGSSDIGEVVNRMRSFIRLDQEPVQFADLNEDIETVIKVCAGEVSEANVMLRTQLGELPRVECRPREINMLLRELLRNAIYYASEGRPSSVPRLVLIRTAQDEDARCVRASFLDNGPGIPKQAREHIFDLFFTTKPEGSGYGLGLSECYAIATRNGGTLSVEELAADEAAKYVTKITLRLPIRIRAPQVFL